MMDFMGSSSEIEIDSRQESRLIIPEPIDENKRKDECKGSGILVLISFRLCLANHPYVSKKSMQMKEDGLLADIDSFLHAFSDPFFDLLFVVL